MGEQRRTATALGFLVASFVLLYWDVFARLVEDWLGDDYSHGFLVVPLAAYFAWERRSRLVAAESRPSLLGLSVVLLSLALHAAGVLGSETFLSRVSILGVIAGTVWFLYGWQHVRILAFPMAFLLLMIPIPRIIFYQITFPLQLLASRVGEAVLSTAHIPVLREGNVMVLANTSLEVAEACSGIRSLISLFTVALAYGYFTDPRPGIRASIALVSVPVAIVANGLRVAGTGMASHYIGPEAAEGFFHTFSGWLVFVAAVVMLFLIHRLFVWLTPSSETPAFSAPLT